MCSFLDSQDSMVKWGILANGERIIMKKVFKYATGQEIPKGAVYLNTVKQTESLTPEDGWMKCWYVWHYFLVEVNE